MDNNAKFNKIKRRGRAYDITKYALSALRNVPEIRNDTRKTDVVVFANVCIDAASFINNVRAIEEYGSNDDIDDLEIMANLVKYFVVRPITESIVLGKYLRDRNS